MAEAHCGSLCLTTLYGHSCYVSRYCVVLYCVTQVPSVGCIVQTLPPLMSSSTAESGESHCTSVGELKRRTLVESGVILVCSVFIKLDS